MITMADNTTIINEAPDDYVCPGCRADLLVHPDRYTCSACGREYPVLFGIADFRLRPDRYLTLEQERDKARRLFEFGKNATFEELLAYYYSITDDVPPGLAARYTAYIRNAPRQAALTLGELDLSADEDVLLDLGCGAGGMLVAAQGRCRSVIGVDIALRWLVICQKRLSEAGISATLLCADVEALPFRDARVTRMTAGDLIEHVYDPAHMLSECHRHLAPGGKLWLSATNRYCIGPNALTRVWWIGFFPAPVRRRILKWLRGVDSLRYINLVSPSGVRKLLERAGFRLLSAAPRQVAPAADIMAYPLQDRLLIRAYRRLSSLGPLRKVLLLTGPAFEMVCVKPRGQETAG